MKKLIIIAALLLQGCFYQTVDKTDIDKATEVCADKGGVYEITAIFDGEEFVTCINGEDKNVWSIK